MRTISHGALIIGTLALAVITLTAAIRLKTLPDHYRQGCHVVQGYEARQSCWAEVSTATITEEIRLGHSGL